MVFYNKCFMRFVVIKNFTVKSYISLWLNQSLVKQLNIKERSFNHANKKQNLYRFKLK